uniref:Uncharacterized protein LOC111138493 isoform X2 n=1 Tax=Crassostrea virginica TaxID=6565 RepID=A0A8B8F1Z1_CRAVI|nr:uncharacterized protein LOC111138493 isoform X2 [Crassostrea virginica]XP_022346203.1 uncharacterized protein LOC111138493 isoform X3 [Crassostrea virginica]
MASGNQDHIDPYNAGYDQLEQNTGASKPTDQYITVHGQSPRFHEHHTDGYPMNNAVIVANTLPVQPGVDAKREFDWLIPAIFATILCGWPCGICAIIEARQAIREYAVGDVIGGRKSSCCAKIYIIISLIVGICGWISIGHYIYNINRQYEP